ncbi:MAG TPA: tetratricopeptide repeat protein [Gemmatimonadaceae bacterium]|jgi:tetratricopeptide (TPR) repeat protein|nr:tetratricopeptide repeat protein [Gemmatimonadaceae bacterium]
MKTPGAESSKDIEILRSFARRIDGADPGAQNNLGVLYFRRGLFDEAIAAFSRALALDERMRVARRNLEIAYAQAGVGENRTQLLAERLATAPDDISVLVEAGIADKSAGNLDQAEQKFRRAMEIDHDSSVLHFFLAEIYYNRGNGEEALRFLRRSIDLNPANPDAHFLAGFILGDLGRLDEAREANRRAIALNPRLTRAEANLALDSTPLGESAKSNGNGAAPVAQQSGSPHLTLALALRLKGYHAEAMKECQAALAAGEDKIVTLETIGSLNLFLGQPRDGLEAFDKRIALGGAGQRIHNQRGIALYLLGRSSEAEQTFRDCLVRMPGYAAAQNNLGALLWDRGKLKEATNHFRRAARDDTTLESARMNLALALFRQSHYQLSLDAYRAVIHDQPDHPLAWCGVGRVLLEFGRFAEARDACVRAIQSDASIAHAHAVLSQALAGLGDVDGAARSADRAAKLDPHALRQPMTLEMDAPESGSLLPGGAKAATAVPDYTLGRDYLSKGLPDRALAEIRRALARGADEMEGQVLLARCFAERGEYDVAEKELAGLSGVAEEHVSVELAHVHRTMGRPREALRRVVDLLKSNVYHLTALVVLGESLLDLKRTRDAAKAFSRVLRLDPDNAVARKYSQLARLENG